MTKCTVSGQPGDPNAHSGAPTDEKRSDGQYKDHYVLCAAERAKGYVRPVREKYQHVGPPGPQFPLRDLTADDEQRYAAYGYVKFEPYPEGHHGSSTGRFWTQDQIDKIGKGCGTVTTMPMACAETYAREPGYYGSTFCCGCGTYLPVGRSGEFVWLDGTNDRVGT